jgi:hypothetical protein
MAEAEFDFYVHAQKHAKEHASVFPHFVGRKAVETETGVQQYIILEDLTSGLEKPSIVDLKIGFRGHDDHAKTLKVVQQIALCTVTTSSSLGFRLCGMRYNDDLGKVVSHGKPWGAQLKKDTMPLALMEFVTQHGHIRFDIVEKILDEMQDLINFFETQKLYKFYSSSILFVFDSAAPVGKPVVRVKLVDFAHTFPNKEGDNTLDENFLLALKNLVEIWSNIKMFGVEIFENQRYNKKEKVFASKFLLPSDRPPYSSENGKTALSFTNPTEWLVDKTNCKDPEGWWYADKRSTATAIGAKVGRHVALQWGEKTSKSVVRRRRWIRKKKE